MSRDIKEDWPLWQLTVGEFFNMIEKKLTRHTEEDKIDVKDYQGKEYVYGLAGLADVLGCSKNHASKLKNKGIFEEAIIQNGRIIIVDKRKVLEILKNLPK